MSRTRNSALARLEAAKDAIITAATAFLVARKAAEPELEARNARLGEDAEWAELWAWTPDCNDLEDMCAGVLRDPPGPMVRKGG